MLRDSVLKERDLIKTIRRLAGSSSLGALMRGIGDDCAVLRLSRGSELLVTTDLCIENVHFRRTWHPAAAVGHRCITRGLSDIAAMGGHPLACFLSLGLPEDVSQSWVNGFLRGLLAQAGRFKIPLAGGDMARRQKKSRWHECVGGPSLGRKRPRRAAGMRGLALPRCTNMLPRRTKSKRC